MKSLKAPFAAESAKTIAVTLNARVSGNATIPDSVAVDLVRLRAVVQSASVTARAASPCVESGSATHHFAPRLDDLSLGRRHRARHSSTTLGNICELYAILHDWGETGETGVFAKDGSQSQLVATSKRQGSYVDATVFIRRPGHPGRRTGSASADDTRARACQYRTVVVASDATTGGAATRARTGCKSAYRKIRPVQRLAWSPRRKTSGTLGRPRDGSTRATIDGAIAARACLGAVRIRPQMS